MIDPIHSLAFSVQANPGVYAVLVGSGVSRGANIPTGWDITLDLVRKVAALHKESCDPDPAAWYEERFGTEPRYSDLLEEVAKTSAERQQMLRGYIEPTEREREEREKCPTAAHRAIAALAAQGFIRVILTTNFDRLIETALGDQGIAPTVLSTSDQVGGALPLVHLSCCVFKLHGDYLDPEIRNTSDELSQYPDDYNRLLDRIFDEFGLIVCGWSAEWDNALYAAIMRAPSRRFTTYWAAAGEITERAQKLIDARAAREVSIGNADHFFSAIQEQVEAINEFSRPHPLSTQAAVTTLKRYLSESRYRIQLSDFVAKTTEDVIDQIAEKVVTIDLGIDFNSDELTARVRTYEAACATLMTMALVGGAWAEPDHYGTWRRALRRLNPRTDIGGVTFWINLQRYPQTLLLYALGLGAVDRGQLPFVEYLVTSTIRSRNADREELAIKELPPFCWLGPDCQVMTRLEGMDRRRAPLNDWIYHTIRPIAEFIVPDDDHFQYIFDKFEILLALAYAYHSVRNDWHSDRNKWVPPGAYGYRFANRQHIMNEIEESISEEKDGAPLVKSRLCGRNRHECLDNLATVKKFVPQLRWY